MDYMWTSTWEEDLLFIGTFLCMIIAFILLCYAFGATILAMYGKHSMAAVVLFWSCVLIDCLFWFFGEPFSAFMLFAWSSPFLAIIMTLMERNRKRKLSDNGQ
jgi:heme/copper-type cytochrome/quinol oxidase subunit 1